jgi:hypothetical protein
MVHWMIFRLSFCTVLTMSLLATAPVVSGQADGAAQDAMSHQSGASTGGSAPAVYDSHHRPITAGGFIASGPAIFRDVTKKAGLATWQHTLGSPAKQFIVETDGSGVALLDYDNDGWLDIYLVNGSTVEAQAGSVVGPRAALFHNNHDGTFTDVAAKAGVTNDRWGFGVAVGDYDNDGWPDLYVTNLGRNRLFHNNHDGTFTDVAPTAGVDLDGWSTGASFGDYDGDGRLDLFVPGYVQFDFAHPPQPGTANTSFHTCQYRGVTVSCGPRGLPGAPDHLFHNNGDGTFTDVSQTAGVNDRQHFYGFTGLFVSIKGNGRPDLLVANDSTPNYYYVNQGNGHFVESGQVSGFAFNRDGREVAGMGLAVGDYRNNGRLDLALTDFSDDNKLLYRNDGDDNFTEVSEEMGIAQHTLPFLGWGVGFLDYDNDGWKDLMMLNGHIYPIVDKMPWGMSYRQRPVLFHNRRGEHFDLVPAVEGSGLSVVACERGAAFGDLFNDGKIDVVVNNLDGVPTLLRNVTNNSRHWVEFKLIGGAASTRDGVGATLRLRTGGMTQREDILSGGSFMSSNDQRAHFGIGDARKVDQLEIDWPSGKVQEVSVPGVDRIYTIVEGQGIVGSLQSTNPNTSTRDITARPHTQSGAPHK